MSRSAAKTALVTGAGSGIGRGVALALAASGLKVGLVGRERAKLDAVASEMGGDGGHVVLPCDVSDRGSVAGMAAEAAAQLGPIDVLVCNAGTNVRDRSLAKLSLDDWDRLIATKLTGAFHLVHAFLPAMRERGDGLIIQVCSVAGKRASVLGGAGYSASKFGQAALGLTLGREEGPHGVRSSVIYPGEVNTPILDARPVPVGVERREQILQPEDVAAAVTFLVSLHPRAHVPELIIKPTVDDFA